MKKPKKKHRNAFAILAKKKKAGQHKTKSRVNGKNKQAELLKEVS
jgi:hypothetical protein